MEPANFQSTIFSFTCANIRSGSIGKVGRSGHAETGVRGADHLGTKDWVIDCQQPTGCWPDGEKMHNAVRTDK